MAARPAASQQDAFCSHLATVQQVSLPERTPQGTSYSIKTRRSPPRSNEEADAVFLWNSSSRPAASQQDAFCSHLATVQQVSLPEGTPQGTSYSIKTRRSPPRSNEEANAVFLWNSIMSRIRRRHVIRQNELWHAYAYMWSRMWMRHVTHVNESCLQGEDGIVSFLPPVVTKSSSPEALALAQHLKSIGATMYGAFW